MVWEDETTNPPQARIVSAKELKRLCPDNLREALDKGSPDKWTWRASYDEEYDGLAAQDMYTVISKEKYQELVQTKGVQVIPSMVVLTVKKDEDGSSVQAKSHIVVLGNLEWQVWEKKDKYAPVIGQASTKLLVSLVVKKGRSLKQGDCKNALCHSVLSEDNAIVVRPPPGCHRSKRGSTGCSIRHCMD